MQLSGQLPDHDIQVGVRHVLSSFSKPSRHIGARTMQLPKALGNCLRSVITIFGALFSTQREASRDW
jgi:hypothetical protein